MIADTHCHLASEEFAADLPEVISRAAQAEVSRILVVGTDTASSARSLEIARANPGYEAAGGVHPHDAADYLEPELWSPLQTLLEAGGFRAVGETGLDFHYNHSPREAQIEILERQIRLARKLHLPLVLHCRDSYEELAACIDRAGEGEAFGVIHCFTGNASQAASFLQRGFYISFSGILTFRNADALRETAKTIPVDRLLVETDAPFLAPVPHRGRRCEPAHTRITLEMLAKVHGEDFSMLAKATTQNAERLFF